MDVSGSRLMFWEGVEENDVEIHPAFTHVLTRSQNHSRILHFIHALPRSFSSETVLTGIYHVVWPLQWGDLEPKKNTCLGRYDDIIMVQNDCGPKNGCKMNTKHDIMAWPNRSLWHPMLEPSQKEAMVKSAGRQRSHDDDGWPQTFSLQSPATEKPSTFSWKQKKTICRFDGNCPDPVTQNLNFWTLTLTHQDLFVKLAAQLASWARLFQLCVTGRCFTLPPCSANIVGAQSALPSSVSPGSKWAGENASHLKQTENVLRSSVIAFPPHHPPIRPKM